MRNTNIPIQILCKYATHHHETQANSFGVFDTIYMQEILIKMF
jgi:hypothetical protein